MLTLVGTYPPIRCGIATFNRDLREALLREGVPSQVAVVAHPEEVALPFPQEVVRVVAKEDREGYRALAMITCLIAINRAGIETRRQPIAGENMRSRAWKR